MRTEVDATTIGEAWLEIARLILADGVTSSYDGRAIRELLLATLRVARPDPSDGLIERRASGERLAWMRANFASRERVAELGDADSYATRLFDYAGTGLDQVEGVIDRLRADPGSRRAVITTFQPLTDTAYVPCVSLLDFFVEPRGLSLVAYCHSIDFGTKGFANLVELAHLERRVADGVGAPVGELTMVVKSAHVYADDLEATRAVLEVGS
ncbi:MAG TPA: thymidylate synthase [Acidimicrobiales bacterium]|nr:MAG: hypothetical protein B7Z69_00690 [Actinobacteria bacterium 21-73-9]HQU26818.1 thymidylate synthase [Acidimicrobiales bacterium]